MITYKKSFFLFDYIFSVALRRVVEGTERTYELSTPAIARLSKHSEPPTRNRYFRSTGCGDFFLRDAQLQLYPMVRMRKARQARRFIRCNSRVFTARIILPKNIHCWKLYTYINLVFKTNILCTETVKATNSTTSAPKNYIMNWLWQDISVTFGLQRAITNTVTAQPQTSTPLDMILSQFLPPPPTPWFPKPSPSGSLSYCLPVSYAFFHGAFSKNFPSSVRILCAVRVSSLATCSAHRNLLYVTVLTN
jgi:hypothetical protein